ncbi:MAG: thioredoxin family protein [Opitutales bacterium]|nr:thioredoxin family protein [Opitutales bacterium]
MSTSPTLRLSFLFLLFALPTLPLRAELVRDGNVGVELVSTQDSVKSGDSVLLALRMVHDEGWHSYWISSTTGYPTTIEFEGMAETVPSFIYWPTPRVYVQSHIVDYVYEGEVLIPILVQAPPGLKPGDTWTVKADVSWLMCKESCVPGSATVTMELSVRDAGAVEKSTEWNARVLKAYKDAPGSLFSTIKWTGYAIQDGRNVKLLLSPSFEDFKAVDGASPVRSADTYGKFYFFGADGNIQAVERQEQRLSSSGQLELDLSLSEYAPERVDSISGLLTAEKEFEPWHKQRAAWVSVPVRQASASAVQSDGAAGSPLGLLAALGLGVLGGLILNLMPCVFPILGLKVMSLVKQAGQGRRAAWAHSLVFTLGVLVSLWTLAGVLLVLRSAGQAAGWGFQLQNPSVLFVLVVIFMLFGLNMLGIFEVGMGAAGLGQGTERKEGYSGAFMSGVLAVLVATPCSAPFLGTAIGFAMVQPALLLLAVFTAVGLGFAAPYLIFAAFPKLLRFLPRPGMWMVRLKQVLSLLLLGTVAYLVWVLSAFYEGWYLSLLGAALNLYFVKALFALALMILAAVVYGYAQRRVNARQRRLGMSAALLPLLAGLAFGWPILPDSDAGIRQNTIIAPAYEAGSDELYYIDWRPGLPEELVANGAIVYVDFTARWCATCQVNKAVVFGSTEVRDFMREHRVYVVKADWTRRDEVIAEELARWGKHAVPFNVVYAPGMDPLELPQVLTPGIVLDALKKAVASRQDSQVAR